MGLDDETKTAFSKAEDAYDVFIELIEELEELVGL